MAELLPGLLQHALLSDVSPLSWRHVGSRDFAVRHRFWLTLSGYLSTPACKGTLELLLQTSIIYITRLQ